MSPAFFEVAEHLPANEAGSSKLISCFTLAVYVAFVLPSRTSLSQITSPHTFLSDSLPTLTTAAVWC